MGNETKLKEKASLFREKSRKIKTCLSSDIIWDVSCYNAS